MASRSLIAGVAALGVVLAAGLGFVFTGSAKSLIEPLVVEAEPFHFDPKNPGRKRFGALIWRGGLVLKASHSQFGGFSSLIIDKSGQSFVAITDQAYWLKGRFGYKDGVVSRVEGPMFGPLLNAQKSGFSGVEKDSEGLVFDAGRFLISFERNHRIGVFQAKEGRPDYQVGSLGLPKGAQGLAFNDGLEALHVMQGGVHKGRLIAFAEHQLTTDGYHQGWFVDGKGGGTFFLKESDGFKITDMTSLEDGGVLFLERFYSREDGVKMRLRYVAASEFKPGVKLAGVELFTADRSYMVDNMEGIVVHKGGHGKTIVTILSDDNFNSSQKTLLMQFELDLEALPGK